MPDAGSPARVRHAGPQHPGQRGGGGDDHPAEPLGKHLAGRGAGGVGHQVGHRLLRPILHHGHQHHR